MISHFGHLLDILSEWVSGWVSEWVSEWGDWWRRVTVAECPVSKAGPFSESRIPLRTEFQEMFGGWPEFHNFMAYALHFSFMIEGQTRWTLLKSLVSQAFFGGDWDFVGEAQGSRLAAGSSLCGGWHLSTTSIRPGTLLPEVEVEWGFYALSARPSSGREHTIVTYSSPVMWLLDEWHRRKPTTGRQSPLSDR